MALKELLVQLDETDEAVLQLHLAVDLALRHASRLTALGSSNCANVDRAFCSDIAVNVGTPILFTPKSTRLSMQANPSPCW